MNLFQCFRSPNAVPATARTSTTQDAALLQLRKHRSLQSNRSLERGFSPRCFASMLTFFMLAGLVLGSSLFARAQSTFGSVRGSVQDSTAAGIPGAKVVLHNTDENTDHTATSDSSGNFLFENVKSGKYTLRAQHNGFADANLTGITLTPRQDLRLAVELTVAQESTTIDVTSTGAAELHTENATLSDSISNQQLTQLPLNARAVSSSPLAGLALSASVVTDSQGNVAVGGAPAAMVGFSVDGISTAN